MRLWEMQHLSYLYDVTSCIISYSMELATISSSQGSDRGVPAGGCQAPSMLGVVDLEQIL